MQNGLIKYSKLIILSIIFVTGTSLSSLAMTISCDRKTNNHIAFNDQSTFTSWFPEKIYYHTDKLLELTRNTENYKIYWEIKGTRVYFSRSSESTSGDRHTTIFKLLPSSKAFHGFKPYGNFADISRIRYTCDKSSAEVIRVLKGGSTTSSSSSSSSSSTNSSTSSSLNKVRSLCTELGFKSGTEKHGDCVMKLIDN